MQTYRARSSVVWGWVAIGLGVVVAVIHVSTVGFEYATGGLGLGAAAALFGYGAFLRPHVATYEDRVELHNVTQTATMPFSRLADLDTRWSLEVIGDDGLKVGAFAAPAPGGVSARRQHVEDKRNDVVDGGVPGRMGDKLGTPSGDAAALVHRASSAWHEAHPTAPASEGPSVTRSPDWLGIVVMAAALAATLWGLFG
ncbi:hypothetical protein [Demequina mangrovi]|uniref:PH domain-containing protein n=1 Tax=Demequina mangrovi TaxID=1043493 RepID=A0A1H6Y1Y0_9MICO|nr:hypothetical protein [Demequina mangrovi]SEJ34476.1 hypothetical protein SAMN05421637_1492 [Demequina mangrovi]